MALHFEEFVVGDTLHTRGRTIGEGDITLYAGLIGDWTPIHVDEHFAQTTPFGTRIAHGTLTLSVAVGLMAQMKLFDGTVIGLISMTWSFSKPVKIGDTVYAHVTPLEKRLSSKPGRGIVKLEILVKNQDDVEVCKGIHDVMVITRDN